MLSESWGYRENKTDLAKVEKTPVEAPLRKDLKNKQVAARKRGRNVIVISDVTVFTSLK